MSKLLSIGEALIDFAPLENGCKVKNVEHFMPKVGGAPANVCGAFTKLGGKSAMITQLGRDPFGDKIIDEFERFGIGTNYVARTGAANTSLAFVAIEENGNREFSFYRNPGADMLMTPDQIQDKWFEDAYALHFCSVSIGDFPMREAHDAAIEAARVHDALISFDPNVRLALWEDHELLKTRILEYMKKSDIVKISDEELEFITGKTSIEEAKDILFAGDVKLVIYTCGGEGAMTFTKNASAQVTSTPVKAVDTTGAGDGFIGSFLYQLYDTGIGKEDVVLLEETKLQEMLHKSNEFCRKSVMEYGGVASYPTTL